MVKDRMDVFWTPFPMLPFAPRVKMAMTLHDFAWVLFPKTMPIQMPWLHRLMVPGSLRRASKIFCVSNATARDLKRFYPWFDQETYLTPNAVSEDFFRPEKVVPRTQINDLIKWDGPFLFSVLRMEERKNIYRLIRVFKILKSKYGIKHKLVISGSKGPNLAGVLKERADNGMQEDIIFLGYVRDPELISLYRYADAISSSPADQRATV